MSNEYTTQFGPNFVGIGAQRAGTSWLYNCLNEHPEVFMPQKEVHYFDRIAKTEAIDWYDKLFQPKTEKQIAGEFTPDYMFHQYTIAELHKHYPNTKLIIILRNPLERSYSAYQLFKAHGRFQEQSFSEALKAEPFLLEQSLYSEQIKNTLKYFPREQVLIKLYDDIAKQPLAFYQSVCDFLSIDSSFIPSSLKVVKNSSAMSGMQNTFNLPALQKKIEKSLLAKPFKAFKTTKLANKLKRSLITKQKNNNKIIVNVEVQNVINYDIKMLEKILSKPLSSWFQYNK